jgi:hypothetical protein
LAFAKSQTCVQEDDASHGRKLVLRDGQWQIVFIAKVAVPFND